MAGQTLTITMTTCHTILCTNIRSPDLPCSLCQVT